MTEERKTAVIAIGGNSLIIDKQHEDVPSQWEAVQETCKHIADMIERGWNLIITHGNGPQVGFILRRNELAAHEVHTTPLDMIGADTQGSIGYMIAQTLENEFKERGISQPIAAVVTQVLVDRDEHLGARQGREKEAGKGCEKGRLHFVRARVPGRPVPSIGARVYGHSPVGRGSHGAGRGAGGRRPGQPRPSSRRGPSTASNLPLAALRREWTSRAA